MVKKSQQSKFMTALTSPKRFKLLEDGWIQDALTGLDWAPSSQKRMNFSAAQKYCVDTGGRLPEIQELHSLVDFSKEQPSCNVEIFKDMKHDDWYWSGTKTTWNKSASWCVSFGYGLVDYNFEDGGSYVRPVRASQ